MNGIASHVDKVTAPVPASRAERRAQEQAKTRAARQRHRSQVRIQKALSAYPKGAAA